VTRQLVYDPYKRVMFEFCGSTRLANRVEFGLVGQPDQPKINTITRFANLK